MNEVKSKQTAKEQLCNGLHQLGLDNEKSEPIMQFLTLLRQWNETYNMTAITEWTDMVVQHGLDSAAIVSHIEGQSIIDVGTGGGLPGIILALFKPKANIYLLDSVAKKTRFLKHVKRSLKLDNVTVINQRVENYIPDKKFDVVISRAFAEVNQFLSITAHLGDQHSRFVAMKGPKEEPLSDDSKFNRVSMLSIEVPFLTAERTLYQYMKKAK